MGSTIEKRKGDNRNLTDPNYAFGHYVNDACIQKGKELVKQVEESRKKKAESVKKDIAHASKDAAGYLSGLAKGRLRFGGTRTYNCFECEYKGMGLKDDLGQSVCGFKCTNGEYFSQKKELGGNDDNEH